MLENPYLVILKRLISNLNLWIATVVLFISLNQINIWFGNVLLDQLKVKGHSPAKEFKMVLFPEPGFTRAIVSVKL